MINKEKLLKDLYIKPSERVGLFLIFLLVIIGVILAYFNPSYYAGTYVREDYLIEWLTVLALVGGTLTCWYRVAILSPFRSRLFIASLVAMGLLFFFGAGEEISWGQRIFLFERPSFFLKHNSQMETNIHNLVIGNHKINKLVFGTLLGIFMAFYLLIFPLLYRKIARLRKWVNALAIPVPRLFHTIFYLFLFILVEFTPSPKRGELLEFGGVWITLLIFLRPHNRKTFSRICLFH